MLDSSRILFMKTLIAIISLIFSMTASAGTEEGKVTGVLVNKNGLHYFYMEGMKHMVAPLVQRPNTGLLQMKIR